ncbi:MAG: hypothetical protein NZ922_06780 [Candidatus Methanomethyliaceae archaeon]|nr:hypothetical protein [Candidatus Methanomethyliaceae archaeon]MDW7971139.1 hypothetical protein [Nitrososphaerota archaeon]
MGRKALLTLFAIIGFFLGVFIYYVSKKLPSLIQQLLPIFANFEWIFAGIIGSIVTVMAVVVWAYATS